MVQRRGTSSSFILATSLVQRYEDTLSRLAYFPLLIFLEVTFKLHPPAPTSEETGATVQFRHVSAGNRLLIEHPFDGQEVDPTEASPVT
jgi:hypothetical protein